MKDYKVIIIPFIIFFILGVSLFIYKQIQRSKKYDENYLNQYYNGIIIEIKYISGKRGSPDIMINDKWFYMGFDAEIEASYYFNVGDSIVKKRNNLDVYVYRKDSFGNWKMKVFKPRLK